MADRNLDWREFVNALVYCFGCGRFGKPSSKGIPTGWKVLYNPHPEGRPGLHVCSQGCVAKVSAALREGPVLEPLEMGAPPPMPQEVREQALSGAVKHKVTERVTQALKPFVGRELGDDEEIVEVVSDAITETLVEQPSMRSLFDAAALREVNRVADWQRAVHGYDDFGSEEENENEPEPDLTDAEEDPDVPWNEEEPMRIHAGVEVPEVPHLHLVPIGDPDANKRLADDTTVKSEEGVVDCAGVKFGCRIVGVPEPKENYCSECGKYLAYEDEAYINRPELRCVCHGDAYADCEPDEPC